MNVHASALGKLAHAGERELIRAVARQIRFETKQPPHPIFEPPVLKLTRAQIVETGVTAAPR